VSLDGASKTPSVAELDLAGCQAMANAVPLSLLDTALPGRTV
jgi:hypothetical protein